MLHFSVVPFPVAFQPKTVHVHPFVVLWIPSIHHWSGHSPSVSVSNFFSFFFFLDRSKYFHTSHFILHLWRIFVKSCASGLKIFDLFLSWSADFTVGVTTPTNDLVDDHLRRRRWRDMYSIPGKRRFVIDCSGNMHSDPARGNGRSTFIAKLYSREQNYNFAIPSRLDVQVVQFHRNDLCRTVMGTEGWNEEGNSPGIK